MSRHRVTMLNASLRRFDDPERSRDPRVRALVAALGEIEPAPAPRAEFRADLRAQLVAVAPRLVAEGAADETPVPHRGAAERRRSRLLAARRPLMMAGAALAAFVVLLGGAVWISQKALPGDALYGLKRASENVQLSLASGDTARAKDYLAQAGTRVDEVSSLHGHPSAAISPHSASLVTSTLNAADADVRSASKLLGDEAVRDASAGPLQTMITWVPPELARLKAIGASLPASPTSQQVLGSSTLFFQVLNRAAALSRLSNCACMAGAASDSLGPVPCTTCAAAPSSSPGAPKAPVPASRPAAGSSTAPKPNASSSPAAEPSGSSTAASAPHPNVVAPGSASKSAVAPAPASSAGPAVSKAPALPLPLPSNGVTVSLPPLVPSAGSPSPSSSSTCAIEIVIPGLLELNTCTGLYIQLG